MSCCKGSCDSADEAFKSYTTDNTDGAHNAPNDHDVHSIRAATVLAVVLCAVPSSLPEGRRADSGRLCVAQCADS
jgi:hypothetical protein